MADESREALRKGQKGVSYLGVVGLAEQAQKPWGRDRERERLDKQSKLLGRKRE